VGDGSARVVSQGYDGGGALTGGGTGAVNTLRGQSDQPIAAGYWNNSDPGVRAGSVRTVFWAIGARV